VAHVIDSGGPSGPRNAGIRQATGEHLFIFDSDDLMRPGKIRDAVALLQAEPRVGLVFTDFVRIDEHGTELPGRFLDGYGHFRALPKRRVGDGMFVIEGRTAYEGLVWENYIGTSSVALRRSVLREVGLFDESLTNCEDRDLWSASRAVTIWASSIASATRTACTRAASSAAARSGWPRTGSRCCSASCDSRSLARPGARPIAVSPRTTVTWATSVVRADA
jgi:hypothetical protein